MSLLPWWNQLGRKSAVDKKRAERPIFSMPRSCQICRIYQVEECWQRNRRLDVVALGSPFYRQAAPSILASSSTTTLNLIFDDIYDRKVSPACHV